MVENAPILSCQHAGYTIEGYSRAAVQSYWRIPELKVGFDLGAQPWEFMGTPTWMVSHVHLDHVAALPVYVARRRMMRMDPPTIYLPAYAVEDVHRLLRVFQKLDRCRMACNLVGVEPGQELELSRENVVTVFATKHTIPSVGFVIWDRRFKLKDEYLGLPGEQIRDLKLSGVEITREVRVPLVCYTGDTSAEGLDANPVIYEAKILITELSFVRANHRPENVKKYGHLHLNDFIERADLFKNELIICGHLSTRYNEPEVRRTVQNRMPSHLLERVKLWL